MLKIERWREIDREREYMSKHLVEIDRVLKNLCSFECKSESSERECYC